LSLVLLLASGLVVFWGAVVAYTAWMLTHPPRRTYASAVARGRAGDPRELPEPREYREWSATWRGADLPVWDIAGDRVDGPVVVMVHGWGDSRIGALSRLEAVVGEASRVIAWDLPAHGEAHGVCTLGVREVEALAAVLEVIDGRLILFGWSLGAGVSLALAAREEWHERIGGVIAETPYRLAATPARNVLRLRGFPHLLTLRPALGLVSTGLARGGLKPERFDRSTLAAAVQCPVIVIHGELDEVCPLEDGRDIAAAARGQLAVISGGTHNGLWSDAELRRKCLAAVQEFVKAVAPAVAER
jgi:uncharacterized protein